MLSLSKEINFYLCLLVLGWFGMAANGLGICDGAKIVFRQLIFALKLNGITEVEHLTLSRTIANTMLAVVVISSSCLQ